jgi:DNA-binding transcriptional MerR regulator
VRISELAESAGVPTSTVRYYERVGLLSQPARTASGYRDYGQDAAARLLFISRARRMGLSCEQVTSLLSVWADTTCGATQERVIRLIEEKQAAIADRIAELQQFSAQLDDARARLEAEAPPPACRPDLSCCVPESTGVPVSIELTPRR